jgi:peptide/nickel transport system permease protein
MVTVLVLVAIIGPFLVHNATAIYANSFLAPPSLKFWLGTTETGQDVFSQLVVATRGTLEVGFAAGLVATAVSVVVGISGGYLGGKIDEVAALFSNVVLVIPVLPLVIIISAFAKSASVLVLVLVIGLTSWAPSSRVLRAQTLSIRNRDYVLAAKAAGEHGWRIVLFEILPNEWAIIVAHFLFATILAVLIDASLAFLGLGNVNVLTWGSMLYFAQNGEALSVGAWWWFVPPGLCIALLGAGLALMNFGLDEVMNPRLRRR